MSDDRHLDDMAVDRRSETVITEQPGYAASESSIHDVAAERRMRAAWVNRIVWTLVGILEILLGLRFVFKLIGANPGSGFAAFIYGMTGVFLVPFNALVGTPAFENSVLEITTLIAMAVYALFFWIVMRVVQVVIDRPSARTVTRSVREQAPDQGTERTTHITRRN